MISQVRLLAIDIDGTLLDSKFQLANETREALGRAHGQGVHVALVTGRRHAFALPIARQLGFDICLITSNGAVTRTVEGKRFHDDFMPVSTARLVCRHMSEFRKEMVITFDREGRDALVIEDENRLHERIARWIASNAASITRVTPIEECLTADPVQVMVCGSVAGMRPAEARLRDGTLADRVTLLKTQYDDRDLCILDILNVTCSKGSALKRWVEHLGVPREEVMAIGDNYNDVEMLEFAGYPVVMGNACDAMKRKGWLQTRSNDEHGVAVAVEAALTGDHQPLAGISTYP